MISKVQEKQKALELRRKGLTYNEILKEVAVAKSSLSLWLKDLPLTEAEKRYLKTRKDSNISRGRIKAATSIKGNRLKREVEFLKEAHEEFNRLKSNSFFLIGVALYWAEGTKRNESCTFINSDVEMIKMFIKWLEIFELKRNDLDYRLYIHKHYGHENCENYWADKLDILANHIKTSYKPDNKQTKKRPEYKGCLRIRVRKSSKLLFKLKIWQNMLASEYN